MSDQLKQFEDLRQQSLHVYDKYSPRFRVLNEEWTAVAKRAFHEKFPRKKFSLGKAAELLPEFTALKKPFEDQAKAINDEYSKERSALRSALDDLAALIEITPDMRIEEKTAWSPYTSVSSGSYSSQGFGACKYARGSAETSVDHVKLFGIDAEVREVRHDPIVSCGWSIDCADYEVWVGCSPAICEVIRLKPGLTLKQYLQNSWRRGVNPRVANPFIPNDAEAKCGIDYFGNEVKRG